MKLFMRNKMGSRARRVSKKTYEFNRQRTAELIIELYNVIQNQPLHKRIGFAFRVIFKRLPK